MGSAYSTMSTALAPSPRSSNFPSRPSPPLTSSSLASSRPDPSDLASLRTAALQSANRASTLADTRNGSASTALVEPMAKVEITSAKAEEKEEGEISESEEEVKVVEPEARERRRRRGSSPSRRDSSLTQRDSLPKRKRSPSPVRSSQSDRRPPIGPRKSSVMSYRSGSPSTRIAALKTEDKDSAPARASPGPVESAPSDISPEEAQQYMDIIRNLLYEGFSPDALIRRGATPKYVTAVCEEIVAGTRRRKALWLQARDSNEGRMDSPEVEVSVTMTRDESNSSESSAEIRLIEKPSPPRTRPARLVSSSHWTPAVPPVKSTGTGLSQAIPIDSFKPSQPPGRNGLPLPYSAIINGSSSSVAPSSITSTLEAASLAIAPSPPSIPKAASSSSSAYRIPPERPIASPSSLPTKPTHSVVTAKAPGPRGSAFRTVRRSVNAIIERPVLSDEADKMDSAEVSATDLPSPYDPLPFKSPLHFGSLSSTAVFPSRTAPDNVGSSSMQVSVSVELAAKNAILETRRKALESMKLRRAAAKTAQPVSSDILMEVDPKNTPTPDTHTTLPPVTAAEKTIEQEVADLEQEVLDLQSTVNDMDVDEPEEGEIASSSLPTSIPPVISISTPISASLPIIRPARELNRPNAEDLDNRPTSIPSRLLPPSKRRVFGGNAQRPIRLVVKLDDSDSDTDHEDEIPGTANEAETHRLLAEKEEGIRLLKEKIAERLKAKEVKRLQLAEGGDLSSLEGSPTPSESKLPGVPQSAMEVAVAEVTSASAAIIDLTGTSDGSPSHQSDAMVTDEDPVLVDLSEGRDGADADAERLRESEKFHRSPSPQVTQPATNGQSIPPQSHHQPAPFLAYQPILRRYPQLATSSTPYSAFPQIPVSLPSPTPDPFESIDRSLLSSIILTHRLQREPDAVMCRAEAGGGRCADPTCQDLHLERGLGPTRGSLSFCLDGKVSAEDRSDEDLVEYIMQVSPTPDTDRSSVFTAIEGVMQDLNIPTPSPMGKGSKGKKKANSNSLPNGIRTGTDESLVELLSRVGKILRNGVS